MLGNTRLIYLIDTAQSSLTHGGIRLRVVHNNVFWTRIPPTTKPNPSFDTYTRAFLLFMCRQQNVFPVNAPVDTILSYGDACNVPTSGLEYPVFGESGDLLGCPYQVPLPIYYWYWKNNGFDDFGDASAMRVSNIKLLPWEKRYAKIHWKGGLHGHKEHGSTCRSKLLSLRLSFLNIHGVRGMDALHERHAFRYILNIPGHGVSNRFRNLLLDENAVAIQALESTRRIQSWWHQPLIDGFHYIGVRCSHLSEDLSRTFQLLQANQSRARSIARNGAVFARTCMTNKGVHGYFKSSVEFLGKRLSYTPARIGTLLRCHTRDRNTKKRRLGTKRD